MTISEIDVSGALERAKNMAATDKRLPSTVRSIIELLVVIIELLLRRLNVSSRNSSVPPSQDPHRSRGRRVAGEKQGKRKPGGQPGHAGKTIERVADPDVVEELKVNRGKLPRGHRYKRTDDEVRQVIEIVITRKVTEFRAEVLEDELGRQYRAEFPEGVTRPVQYGDSVKVAAIYLSVYQLLPYSRVQDFFRDQAGIEISCGTLCRFSEESYQLLEEFEHAARRQLIQAPLAHFDETGINVAGKLAWLHSASNADWTLYGAHERRGQDGINALGVLPFFTGLACHDHWKAYFNYEDCIHVLCNAHHDRELQGVIENEGHVWAQKMKNLLEQTNAAVNAAGGKLSAHAQAVCRREYRRIIAKAQKECPLAEPVPNKRGATKQSKARNMLDRLRDFENETLRFITNPIIPFSNNQAERDVRMTKVQQKISGCFQSFQGAKIFCRIRSYLSSCIKHGLSATEALTALISGTLPKFCRTSSP
jgi:transposase